MTRADELLVELGLAQSRSKARALIEENAVFCDGVLVDKPSRKIAETSKISVKENAQILKYVSRGGLKLEKLLDYCSISVDGLNALDAGASTGGFTDCLLQRNAKQVLCVDVGSMQLHEKLLGDKRVTNLEKTDIRTLTLQNTPNAPFDIIVGDLSFISLEKVLEVLWTLLKDKGRLLCLVKPQFEADKTLMRKNRGVLRDEAEREKCLHKIENFVHKNLVHSKIIGVCESPILGGDGNKEFLIAVLKDETL